MSAIGIKYSDTWIETLGQINTFNSVKEQNQSLNIENSRLRTELLRVKKYVPNHHKTQKAKLFDTSIWVSTPAEIIRMSTHFSNNLLIANKGKIDGVVKGSGMLDNGHLAGKVIEVTNNECLVFPIIHRNIEWSVRIGKEGAIGRLVWDGEDINTAEVIDISKSALILPGDEVFTTGFQGVFPPDILVGEIKKVTVTEADDFKTVIVKLGVDYSSIRFVEFLTDKRITKSDSLLNSIK